MKSSSLHSCLAAAALLSAVLLGPAAAAAQAPASFTVKSLTPESALKAAQAALKKCRDDGFQVAVAVVDRSGVAQVMLRDRFAGPHTPRTAAGKAWTAVSFRTNTSVLVEETQPGKPSNGIRNLPRATIVAGGVTIEAGGNLFGAIGVSGAPGGAADEACANAGVKAIADDLEF
jgi:uncharacterized protein GlcG (DUF336 family)